MFFPQCGNLEPKREKGEEGKREERRGEIECVQGREMETVREEDREAARRTLQGQCRGKRGE